MFTLARPVIPVSSANTRLTRGGGDGALKAAVR